MISKFQNIQALRAIAALSVVFFHMSGMELKYFPSHYVLGSFLNLGSAGVDLFFVISGFVMVVVTHQKFQNSYTIKTFLYHRISRIYPIYWLITLFSVFMHFAFPHAFVKFPDQPYYIWKSLFLIPQSQYPIVAVGWTLIHEMYFYLVFTLLLFFPEKSFIRLLGVWSFLIIIGNMLLHYYPNISSPAFLLIIHPLTFEFMAGCIIAKLYYAGIRVISPHFFWLALFLLIISFEYYSHLGFFITPQDGAIRLLIYGVACVLLVYAAVGLEAQSKIFPKMLSQIGESSYSIYLLHIFILSTLAKIFSKFPMQSVFVHIAYVITATVTVVLIGKYSYLYIEQPIIKMSRKWRGGAALSQTANG